jgi:hypothetical protein
LEAFVCNLILLRWSHTSGILVIMCIDVIKQSRKRGAKLEAKFATVTDVVYAREFFTNVCFVEIKRILWVVCNGHQEFISFRSSRPMAAEKLESS